MNEIRKQIRRKLKSRAGESIGETLVALLISALALVMLAGAISATARMITVSDKQLGKYYDGDNKLVVRTDNDGVLSVTIAGKETDDAQELHSTVKYFSNDAFANKPVVAYKLP